jgi:N-glycosylase/DNA lyase
MIDNSWYGIHGDRVVKFTKISGTGEPQDQQAQVNVEFFSYPETKFWERSFFRLDDDIDEIITSLSHDRLVSDLFRAYPGLRLIRQDPIQCIFSFICASNTNISMIRRMLLNICRKFGSSVTVDRREFFTFPDVKTISRATVNELRCCGLGYRAKAIKLAAEMIASGVADVELLRQQSYVEAKSVLLKMYGIGNKIADCILLFSLEKLDAFPIDVWITRTLFDHYPSLCKGFVKSKKISPKQYQLLSENSRKHFGRYAGYAQQYLYYHARDSAGREW